MSDSVLYSVSESIATITLNRPQVMNALDAGMIELLRTTCGRAGADPTVRVVVLRGEGRAFLAGGDVGTFHANLGRMTTLVREGAGTLAQAILALRRSPKPVLASVHGAVAGAGVSLMAAADLAIAAEGTQFTLAYSNIGASPDGGATYFLPRILGYRRALELMLLADSFDSRAALEMGLISRIVGADVLQLETARLAQRLARGPTVAYGETKRLAQRGYERSLEAQIEDEVEAFAKCAATADFSEGVTAFVEKRKPKFEGR